MDAELPRPGGGGLDWKRCPALREAHNTCGELTGSRTPPEAFVHMHGTAGGQGGPWLSLSAINMVLTLRPTSGHAQLLMSTVYRSPGSGLRPLGELKPRLQN